MNEPGESSYHQLNYFILVAQEFEFRGRDSGNNVLEFSNDG